LWFINDLERESRSNEIIGSLPALKGGRPVYAWGKWDSFVINYIKTLQRSAGIVNRNIYIADVKEILASKQPSLLTENGGPLIIKNTWAYSLLRRLKYVKRQGTKTAKKVLSSKNILVIFIPACCIGELKPLDVTVNVIFRRQQHEAFSEWYLTSRDNLNKDVI
jgi:hypothetical protein